MSSSPALSLRTAVSLVDEALAQIEPLKDHISRSDSAWDASVWQGLQSQFAVARESAGLSRNLDQAITLADGAASSDPDVRVIKQGDGEPLEISPDSLKATALLVKAMLQAFQQRWQEANSFLQQSLSLHPTADAQLRLASVTAALGERTAASAEFQKVIDFYPESEEAVEAMKALQELDRLRARKWATALILSIFLGWAGGDRFYLGYAGSGTIKLLTFGGAYIWWIVDIIRIATNSIRDANGMKLEK